MAFMHRIAPFLLLLASLPPVLSAQVFVSPSGSDAGPGTRVAPLLSIQKAVDRAAAASGAGREVRIARGTYKPVMGLPAAEPVLIPAGGITVSGGWDASFTQRTGRAVLDGAGRLGSLLTAFDVSGLVLEGLTLTGCAPAEGQDSGALNLTGVSDSGIRDLEIRGNRVSGLVLRGGRGVDVEATLSGNSDPELFWAAAMILDCTDCRFSLEAYDNAAGGAYSSRGNGNAFTGRYLRNSGAAFGGGLCLWRSLGESVDALIEGNEGNDGGGLYASVEGLTAELAVRGEIRNNRALASGGGVWIGGIASAPVRGITVDARIAGNEAGARGGGLHLFGLDGCGVGGEVEGNTAGGFGGGIFASSCNALRIDAKVRGNTAFRHGGAFLVDPSPRIGPRAEFSGNRETGADESGLPGRHPDLFAPAFAAGKAAVMEEYGPFLDRYGLKVRLEGIPDGLAGRLGMILCNLETWFRSLKPEWFRSKGLTIVLSQEVRVSGGGTADVGAAVKGGHAVLYGVRTGTVLSGFFHEFFHAYEADCMGQEEYALWQSANPPGFRYLGYNDYGSKAERLMDSERNYYVGFVTAYCTSHRDEDLADTFLSRIEGHLNRALDEQAQRGAVDRVVAAKYGIMDQMIERLFPGLTADFAFLDRYTAYWKHAIQIQE